MIKTLTLPNFSSIKFEEGKKYGYSKSNGKENLKKLLLEISNNYCMYCYKKLIIDGKLSDAELEHTIEKEFNKKLKECHYNLAIACGNCNGSSKKKEQKKRKIPIKYLRCNKEKCKKIACKKYLDSVELYKKNMKDKNLEKIILQPYGIPGYEIIYDLDSFEFEAADNILYELEDINYIESHISKFKLNDADIKTKVIKEVVNEIFYYKKLPPKEKKYENLIGNLFVEYLYKKNMKKKDMLIFCEEIYENLIMNYET